MQRDTYVTFGSGYALTLKYPIADRHRWDTRAANMLVQWQDQSRWTRRDLNRFLRRHVLVHGRMDSAGKGEQRTG